MFLASLNLGFLGCRIGIIMSSSQGLLRGLNKLMQDLTQNSVTCGSLSMSWSKDPLNFKQNEILGLD